MYNLYKEYLEYFDLLDNQILLRSRDRKLEKANKKNENLINEIKEMMMKQNESIIKLLSTKNFMKNKYSF